MRFAPTQEAYDGYIASKPTHAQSANLILNIHKIYDNNIFGEYEEVIGMCTYADAIEKKGIKQINDLYSKLFDDGRIEDVKKAVKNPEYQKKLYEEYFPDNNKVTV